MSDPGGLNVSACSGDEVATLQWGPQDAARRVRGARFRIAPPRFGSRRLRRVAGVEVFPPRGRRSSAMHSSLIGIERLAP